MRPKVPNVYRSGFWALTIQGSMRFIGLLSVLILARLLSPADFGMVSLALVITAFVDLLAAVGFRQALLRIPDPTREHQDTAWTIQLILYSTMGLLTILSAPVAASFYKEPALLAVVAALSVRFFFLAVVNIGIVDFDRQLDFARDLRMRMGARVASLAVTVAAALILRNYWALVVGMVSYTAFLTIASYIAHPYRPRLSLARRSELLGTSVWIFVAALAESVQTQIERLVLGRVGTAHLVGLFSVSKDLSIIFTTEVATALNRVTFVTVASDPRQIEEQSGRVGQILGTYALIAAPMGLGLAATAEDTVAVLLGSQWLEAAPFLRVIAVYSAFFAVYKSVASSLQASGRAKQVAMLSGAGAFALTAAVIATGSVTRDGMSVAYSAAGATFALLCASILFMSGVAGLSPARLAAQVLRPFAGAAAMAAIVWSWTPETGWPVADLFAGICIGVASYPLAVLSIWAVSGFPSGAEGQIVRRLAELRAQRAARRLGEGART